MFPNNDIDSIIFRSNICSALYYSITNSKNNSNSTNNSQSSFFIELVDFQIKNGMIVGSITLNSAAQLKFRQAKSGSESTAYLDIMELEKSYWYYHNIFRLEKPLQYEKAEKEGAKIVENARIASPSPSLMSLPSLAAYRHSQRAIFDDASFNATGPISLKDGSGHRLLYLGVSSASYINCAQGMSANLNSRAAGSGGKRDKQSANGGAFEEAQELGENVKSEGGKIYFLIIKFLRLFIYFTSISNLFLINISISYYIQYVRRHSRPVNRLRSRQGKAEHHLWSQGAAAPRRDGHRQCSRRISGT
jgi:hypothetical protein